MIEGDFSILHLPGTPKSPSVNLDLTTIIATEARIHEIGFLTPQKAPELLAVFNEAHRDLAVLSVKAKLALHSAQQEADRVKAVLILDKIPGILTAKGLVKPGNPAGSADLREACLALDIEYQEAMDRVAYVEAVVELLHGKEESIRRAHFSVSSIFKETGFSARVSMGGGIPEGIEVGNNPPQKYCLPEGYKPPVRGSVK